MILRVCLFDRSGGCPAFMFYSMKFADEHVLIRNVRESRRLGYLTGVEGAQLLSPVMPARHSNFQSNKIG